MRSLLFVAFVLLCHTQHSTVEAAEPFELVDGERIVFVGNTLIERAQRFDYLETRLTALHPDRRLTFRNLGWSGDTVFGDSRAGFDTATEGYQRLIDQVRGLEPTVIVVGYGNNAAFAGADGLPRFIEGTVRLWDDLATTGARIVVLSPTPQEDVGIPRTTPKKYNRAARLYADKLRELADGRGYRFVDQFQLHASSRDMAWTYNGLHFDALGYWLWSNALCSALGHGPIDWSVDVDASGTQHEIAGTKIDHLVATDAGVRFSALDVQLPPAPPPDDRLTLDSTDWSHRRLRVRGLPPGQYSLSIDGQQVARASHKAWAEGVELIAGPEFDQVEQLRQTILKKNELYFHRWRPQNETYLFGFRKHEQGQNAVEIPQFDPLVAEQESFIAQQCQPVAHVYELQSIDEVKK